MICVTSIGSYTGQVKKLFEELYQLRRKTGRSKLLPMQMIRKLFRWGQMMINETHTEVS